MATQISFIFIPIWWRWTHFDEHSFQMGWKHQLYSHCFRALKYSQRKRCESNSQPFRPTLGPVSFTKSGIWYIGISGFCQTPKKKTPKSPKRIQDSCFVCFSFFGLFQDQSIKIKIISSYLMTDPWDWYIYLHEWLIFMVNVGEDTIHGPHGWYMGHIERLESLRNVSRASGLSTEIYAFSA